MRSFWALGQVLTLTTLAGCGSTSATTQLPLASQGSVVSDDGFNLIVARRPTAERLWVSLWIDSGLIQSEPPALATLAAWSSIDTDSEIEVLVLPDATELTLPCSRAALAQCIGDLNRALDARTPSASAFQSALRRLQASRRGAASDTARIGDRLATEALFGLREGALDPFAGERSALTPEAIQRHRERFWRRDHALWIVIGDADTDSVARILSETNPATPQVPPSSPALSVRPRALRFEEGSSRASSIALAVRDERVGAGIAQVISDELPESAAHLFQIAGHHVLLVRDPDHTGLESALAYARQVFAPRSPPSSIQEPRELAATLAARWLGSRSASSPFVAGLGIGVVGAEPPSDEQETAESEIPDGAVTVVPGDYGHAAVAFSYAFPATEEPARLHGLRSLIASVIEHCVSRSHATVASWVDETTIGVTVDSPDRDPSDALRIGGHCARHLELSAGSLDTYRAATLARIGAHERQLALIAKAASPRSPGLIGRLGSPQGIAAIRPGDVVDTWSRLVSRQRLRIAVVGPEDAEDALRRARAVYRRFPDTPVPISRPHSSPMDEALIRVEGPDALYVVLRDPDPRSAEAELGANAARHALIDRLARSNIDTLWSAAGGGAGGVWLALSLRISDAEFSTLAPRLESLTAEAVESAESRVADLAEQADLRLAWSRGHPSGLAHRVVTGETRERVDRGRALDAANALLRSPVHYVLARSL